MSENLLSDISAGTMEIRGKYMCTYQTEVIETKGSGKGPAGWMKLDEATVYLDHPVHAPFAHSVNIDLRDKNNKSGGRVALELEPAAALQLAKTILQILKDTPATVSGINDITLLTLP